MKSSRGKLIALAVVVLAVALVVGVIGVRYFIRQRDAWHFKAQFDNTSGLYVGNKVAVLGMPVGKVTKMTPKGGYIEVDFTVDRNIKVPADVQAVTISNSILTDRQIELSPVYKSGPILQDHSTIGLARTRTPIEFARTLDLLNNLTKSINGDGQGNGPLADIVNSGAAIADGRGEEMKATFSQLSDALRLSADRGTVTREQLTTVIKNVSTLFDASAKNDAMLRQFGSNIRQISDIVADEDLGSGTTGKKINDVLIQLSEVLDANRDHLKSIVSNGNTAFNTLIEYKRDLAELLDVAPMTLDNIYNVIDTKNGNLRVHVLTDKVLFDTQLVKEVCNMMGLRQLGCSTGTMQDFGPDFGLTYVLDGLAAMGQK